MTTKQEAKARAADFIQSRDFQFRAWLTSGQIKITHKDGLWAGVYRPHPQYSYFVLTGFIFGEPDAEVRIHVSDYYRILAHFDLDSV